MKTYRITTRSGSEYIITHDQETDKFNLGAVAIPNHSSYGTFLLGTTKPVKTPSPWPVELDKRVHFIFPDEPGGMLNRYNHMSISPVVAVEEVK